MSDAEIAEKLNAIFDMRPKAIVERFGLKNPIFSDTAAYGHMGRKPYQKEVEFFTVEIEENAHEKRETRKKIKKEIEFYTWEKLDYVDKVKSAFGIKYPSWLRDNFL